MQPFSPAELREFTEHAAAAGTRPSGRTRPAPLAFEQRKRALVVDDNAVNQMVATGMLQVLGFEVDTANDGTEAIERCMALAPDLVLMDLHMPGMDGLEATRRLRLLQREGAIPSFPILASTADTTSQDACAAAGMDGHLPKPLDLVGLEDQLRRLMVG
jgi:CheY-like chemotaxis protein